MATGLTVEELRAKIVSTLGYADPSSHLDSLQTVVVMSYLGNRGFDVNALDLADRPNTIEGWVAWADQRSSAS